ncbi:MAG: SIS domain-containing protein [Candidatus Aerophobus sp.]|nr:MAG: SIS domain-containing protein [Candidatus Aerophobus sp.]
MERVGKTIEEMASNAIEISKSLSDTDTRIMEDLLLNARKIYTIGVGHSGLIGKILAMKLMQLGFASYVVGDVTTPGLREGDVVVAISQSGETISVVALSKKAKKLGGKVIAITAFPQSSLGRMAEHIVKIEAKAPGKKFPALSALGDEEHTNLSGALFGINSSLFFYGLICDLVLRAKQTPSKIDSRHANIE